MYHHDARDYATATSEAAKHFQRRLEEQIHSSVQRVTAVIEQVQNDVPTDAIVLGKKLEFQAKDGGVNIITPEYIGEPGTGEPGTGNAATAALTIHKHAFQQLADKAKIRNLSTVLRELVDKGEWGQQLAAEILSDVYSHLNGDRFLLRAVRGELRGFLSDQYRRLDSRPLLDAFVLAIQRFGARPIDGFALQTKVNVRAVLPYVFEPFPGEIMSFGAQLSDSDFGDGTLSVSGFVNRMWCTNLATTEDVLKQIHLGRKLSDNVVFSARTLQLDTQAMASAIHDVAGHVLGAPAVNRYLSLVRTANEEKIEPNQIQAWVKKNLTKAETEKAVDKFTSADIELLPAGQTKWRWSNALSWLANETVDEHRKLELQEYAGTILKPA